LLPFDYTITDEDLENFSFFKINMIANAAEAGETSATDDVWIFVNCIEAGSTLYANKPYLYKPKAAVDNYEFVSENVTLKAPTSSVLLQTATTEATYSFYGTYETTRLHPHCSECPNTLLKNC
jgi:methyl coenzyme M reductase alpha subunit